MRIALLLVVIGMVGFIIYKKSVTSSLPTANVVENRSSADTIFHGYMMHTSSQWNRYEFVIPENCQAIDHILHCQTATGELRIQIDVAGHGAGQEQTKIVKQNAKESFPTGEATITLLETVKSKEIFGSYYFTKTGGKPTFGFDVYPTASANRDQLEISMHKILSTFQFLP